MLKADTEVNYFCMKWLRVFYLERTNKGINVGIFGIRFAIHKRQERQGKKRKSRINVRPFFSYDHRDVIFKALSRFARFIEGLIRSLTINNIGIRASTPDPALNGIMYGLLYNVQSERTKIDLNFVGSNSMLVEGNLSILSVMLQFIKLVLSLPILGIMKMRKTVFRPPRH